MSPALGQTQKRKQFEEGGAPDEGLTSKRRRVLSTATPCYQEPIGNHDDQDQYRVKFWLQAKEWPKEEFATSGRTWKDLEADTLARERAFDKMAQQADIRFARLKAKSSNASLRDQSVGPAPNKSAKGKGAKDKNQDVNNQGANQQDTNSQITNGREKKGSEDKSIPYESSGYLEELERKGNSYLKDSNTGITPDSQAKLERWKSECLTVMQDPPCSDKRFERTCINLLGRNEAKVIYDLTQWIAPSVDNLKLDGADELNNLVENRDEPWASCIPITQKPPWPDYCVGFARSAFTRSQLEKLTPLVGTQPSQNESLYLATSRVYFPFFTCEVKPGGGNLDVADRQNAHSMTVAARGIHQLFTLVDREADLYGKLLAFSFSHDPSAVRVYGHYIALDDENKVAYYRHDVGNWPLKPPLGGSRWAAYRFANKLYYNFAPSLKELICSAIDQLPSQTDPAKSFASSSNAPGLEPDVEGSTNTSVTDGQATPDNDAIPETNERQKRGPSTRRHGK